MGQKIILISRLNALIVTQVVLNEDVETSNGLSKEVMIFVKTKLSKYEYPREIDFIDEIPKPLTEKSKERN